MFESKILKGIIYVGLGAISYGTLATFVKIAYSEGYTTAEVSSSQFVIGIIGVFIIHLLQKNNIEDEKPNLKNIYQLILAGTSLGLTSVFYYLCVKHLKVSIAIVLLMQTVWMGVLLEAILEKKAPATRKIFAVIIVLIGTILATNLLKTNFILNFQGIVYGLLAALSFTTTMFTANKVAQKVNATLRSLYMLIGGFLVIIIFVIQTQNTLFNFDIFLKWGIILALFGTIIPPILMNKGFPYTGIGIGSIIATLELPTSILMAYFILNEQITIEQWLGIVFIILAIVVINIKNNHAK